ncbi:PAS domain-containing protein [Curvivirga aplysinae]|uniref:PAS domain-containing protein n=1 Tax=Curvivirga aplysinae TaxID=2529852 RepID=UPI001C3F9E9B|nr:PAS domain-containing protein [Curvivirga aplysinae]
MLTKIENEGARVLLNHWSEIYERENRLPQRTDIDPISFIKFTPYIWIIKRVSGEEYIYRLAGDHIIENFGTGIAGTYIHDFFSGEMLDTMITFLNKITDENTVALHHGYRYLPTCDYPVQYERLSLPLANHDGKVKYIIGYTFFHGIPDMAEAILGKNSAFTHEEYYTI